MKMNKVDLMLGFQILIINSHFESWFVYRLGLVNHYFIFLFCISFSFFFCWCFSFFEFICSALASRSNRAGWHFQFCLHFAKNTKNTFWNVRFVHKHVLMIVIESIQVELFERLEWICWNEEKMFSPNERFKPTYIGVSFFDFDNIFNVHFTKFFSICSQWNSVGFPFNNFFHWGKTLMLIKRSTYNVITKWETWIWLLCIVWWKKIT